MAKLRNYFVLLGINNEAEDAEIDRAVNELTEDMLYDYDPTEIRQTLSDRDARAKMWEALRENRTFDVDYNREEVKIEFISKLPQEYGEFTVYCGGGSCYLKPGRYSAQFLANKNICETGTNFQGKISVSPYRDIKVYYPVIRRGDLVYVIGSERNRAFVYDICVQPLYEYVSVNFKWGKFTDVFYVTAPQDGVRKFPPSLADRLYTVSSLDVNGEKVEIFGRFTDKNRYNEVRFCERNIRGEYSELTEND